MCARKGHTLSANNTTLQWSTAWLAIKSSRWQNIVLGTMMGRYTSVTFPTLNCDCSWCRIRNHICKNFAGVQVELGSLYIKLEPIKYILIFFDPTCKWISNAWISQNSLSFPTHRRKIVAKVDRNKKIYICRRINQSK